MGNNHLSWYNTSNRKVMILAFEQIYQKKISQFISQTDVEVNDSMGFKNEEIKYNKLNLKLWYLSVNNRYLWKHHFPGTQGVVIIFSFRDKVQDERIIYEVMNVLKDQNIVGVPILLLFDKNNKEPKVVENLKTEIQREMNEQELSLVKIDEIDFDNDDNQLKEGFEWLCTNMKALK